MEVLEILRRTTSRLLGLVGNEVTAPAARRTRRRSRSRVRSRLDGAGNA